MEREYEIFELSDGTPLWRGHASGLQEARLMLQQISKDTRNECFAMHLSTREIVARMNIRSLGGSGGKPLIFQIAYDNRLAIARSEVLRLHGYEVVSVIGNQSAKVILGMGQHYDLFLVGHGAPEEVRDEMVAWLRANYTDVPILALNSAAIPGLAGADYNVKLNGPETWLPVIATAVAGRPGSGSSSSN